MKKYILAICFGILMLSQTMSAWATWTITPTILSYQGHTAIFQVLFTSDGSALTAGNISTNMTPELLALFKKGLFYKMAVVPGTSSVAPDTTIDITFLDVTLQWNHFVHTTYSYTANTPNIDLAEDDGYALSGWDMTYITVNDIGSSGDQFTLIIEGNVQ